MIVYLITCLVNGKKYVGKSTRTLPMRWKEHRSEAMQGRKEWDLYRDMREHGFEAFTIEILREYDCQARINAAERRFILLYRCVEDGYNKKISGGGGLKKIKGSNLGRPRDQTTKDKISERMVEAWQRRRAASSPPPF